MIKYIFDNLFSVFCEIEHAKGSEGMDLWHKNIPVDGWMVVKEFCELAMGMPGNWIIPFYSSSGRTVISRESLIRSTSSHLYIHKCPLGIQPFTFSSFISNSNWICNIVLAGSLWCLHEMDSIHVFIFLYNLFQLSTLPFTPHSSLDDV